MADEKVYGIGEGKSKYEVYPKDETYSKDEVYSKSETWNKGMLYVKTECDARYPLKQEVAPRNHAVTYDLYGLGTDTKYGHVKLTTSTAAPTGNQDGIALAGSMGYTLKQYTDTMVTTKAQTPLNGVVFFYGALSPAQVAQVMGYGTWQHLGHMQVTGDGATIQIQAYRRIQ